MTVRNETVLSSYDTFAAENHPNRNYGDLNWLIVDDSSGSRNYVYLYFPVDGRKFRGVTVRKARLVLFNRTNNPSASFTVHRVTQNWREHKLTWANKPNQTAIGGTVSGGGNKDTRINIDVTQIMQDWAQGSAVYGIRLTTTTNASLFFYSSEAAQRHQPKLEVEWVPLPEVPKNLKPGEDQAVEDANPMFRWDGDTPTQVHVQIDDVEDFQSPIFDSGWIVSDQTQYDSSLSISPPPPNLTDNAAYYWRVQYVDEEDQTSAWSEAVRFERRTLGGLSIVSPTGTIETTTPTITHSFTGRQQSAVKYELYKVLVPDQPDKVLVWSRDWIQSEDTDFELPDGKIEYSVQMNPTVSYELHVFVRDTYEREVEATSSFQFSHVLTVAPADTFVVADQEGHVLLTWHRSSVPSYFAVRVDDVLIEDRVVPGDISQGGGNYEMRLNAVSPHLPHTFSVETVDLISGVYKYSQNNPTVVHTFAPIGIWLIDPDSGLEVHIIGQEAADVGIGETGETFFPLGRQDPVRVVDQVRGLEGSVSGTLITVEGRAASVEHANLKALKTDPLATRRLVLAYTNIPVLVSEIAVPPLPLVEEGYDISFDFWQNGEFDEPAVWGGVGGSGSNIPPGDAFTDGFDGGFS